MSWHASFLVGTLLGIAIGASLILLLVLILLAGRDTDCTEEEDDNEDNPEEIDNIKSKHYGKF